jgi:hypothetical protein
LHHTFAHCDHADSLDKVNVILIKVSFKPFHVLEAFLEHPQTVACEKGNQWHRARSCEISTYEKVLNRLELSQR